MDYHIQENSPAPETLSQMARLWNGNAAGRHAYFPWTAEGLYALLTRGGIVIGDLLTAHHIPSGEMIGFVHTTETRENGYPPAGVIEALLVDSPYRRHGAGTALLNAAIRRLERTRPRPLLLDALGAWPFGYAFNTLADGSERSGVFLTEAPAYRLFRRAGFEPVRKSIVMRADTSRDVRRPIPPQCAFNMAKRTENSWLDRVFRGRELFDHDLIIPGERLLSRAIFGLMEGESRQEGHAIFSVFGVNTPFDVQRKGYAGMNISHLLDYVKNLGGKFIELHVYADNIPALALYRSLGFKELAETMMMHRRL